MMQKSLAFCLAFGFLACGTTAVTGPEDAGTTAVDATVASADALPSADATPAEDATAAPDAQAVEDAQAAADAGPVEDAQAAPDAGVDAGAEPDASAVPDASTASDAGGIADANATVDAGGTSDAGPALNLRTCPTTGRGGIRPLGTCFVVSPAETGANPAGDNATTDHYVLEPVSNPRGTLIVELNGSLGSPAGQVADPDRNFYNAVADAGFHVIGLAYRSTLVVGQVCSNQPSCFAPTRQTLVTGVLAAGAPRTLNNIRVDEGIVTRLDLALRTLIAFRPGQGWEQFIAHPDRTAAAERIDWSRIMMSGHSQGGGHAAYLGKLFPVARVVQLSSTCDEVMGTPAPWTAASGTWATVPATAYVGFSAPTTFTGGRPSSGDTICGYHAAVWQNMGLSAQNQHDDAAGCGAQNTHGASIGCVDNYPRWAGLFIP